MATPGARLTDAEREQYERDGYVVRERIFSQHEIDAVTDECETLVERLVREAKGTRSRVGSYVFEPSPETNVWLKWEGDSDVIHGIEPFAHISPELEQWAYDRRFVEPMKDICADERPVLFTEKLNLKRAHAGGVNPLHQDFPYWRDVSDDATRVATAMLFLDDANLDNGCLHVVPGSHRDGMRMTRTDSDPFGNLEMDAAEFSGGDPIPLEVGAGTVVYFGPYLVHMSEPNRSDADRRSLLYSYQPHGHRHLREIDAQQRKARA